MKDNSSLFSDMREEQTNLPMAPASEETDDGIFINWPGFEYDGDESQDSGSLSDEDIS